MDKIIGLWFKRATFAERLHNEGSVFIGPPSSAIVSSMASKSESKHIMIGTCFSRCRQILLILQFPQGSLGMILC
ncbi:hypothetical protein BDZ89DRAFT_358776 [Hymenopellis radicata]|nr:hypothetical protein BDZ89DRAFT_358776 [Hymenopellis radicata]